MQLPGHALSEGRRKLILLAQGEHTSTFITCLKLLFLLPRIDNNPSNRQSVLWTSRCIIAIGLAALPHHLIKKRLINLIETTFLREGTLYLGCNDKIAFLPQMTKNGLNFGLAKMLVTL